VSALAAASKPASQQAGEENRAIRRVAGVIDRAHLADEVIADLPATELV
jgi:hypothetical protein